MDAKKIKDFLSNNAIVILLLLLVLFVGFTQQGFFTLTNFNNITSNVAPRFIIALGVSGCLITKGTDLSAGRLVGLGGVLACTLLQRADYSDRFFQNLPQFPLFAVFIVVVIVTALFGLLNGLVVSYLKVPPFLATLGMQTIVYGINLVYSGADPIGGLRKDFTTIASGGIDLGFYKLKWLLIIAIVMGLIFWFLYNKTRHGKYMYAIGGNEIAAEVSGVNTTAALLRIYTLAGLMYGFAGFLLAAKSGGASVNLGLGYELEAIAACTIGGVSTTGGIGKVQGILLGVLVFELMKTSLQYLGVDTSYQYIAQGLVIIVAVALDIRKYTAKK
ncbi:galactose/methyl galactoside ABC transporter permease MglC [Anaerorhabdus sp.]|jgi:methyl-galactoside transport system permease protein|uniref:galactose/methyl galactoside ABC transporter permease MglC n=1 Tax=Anaerorhabdus sp. TaxID=1872524 RepID=UPI002FCA78AB